MPDCTTISTSAAALNAISRVPPQPERTCGDFLQTRQNEKTEPRSGLKSLQLPIALTNRPARGYIASLELQPRAFVTPRADVAAFIADEIENNGYIRQAVSSHRVMDRRRITNYRFGLKASECPNLSTRNATSG
jgi:hypothetical protein